MDLTGTRGQRAKAIGFAITLPKDGGHPMLLIGATGTGVFYSEAVGDGPVSGVVGVIGSAAIEGFKWAANNPVPLLLGLLAIVATVYFRRSLAHEPNA
jgi:hypothetical protein